MAKPATVNVIFRPLEEKKLKIPKEIRVSVGTEITWNIEIQGPDAFFLPNEFFGSDLEFTIYFEKKTPFEWKSQSMLLYNLPGQPISFMLARSVASVVNEYKYGIKVSRIGEKKPIYDEDPFLIVY